MLNRKPVHQSPLRPWKSGKDQTVGVLRSEPDELAKSHGVVFVDAHDDLDSFKEAVIDLSSGDQVLLVRYRGNQSPGTEVWADSAADAQQMRNELLSELGLDASAFTWIPETERSA